MKPLKDYMVNESRDISKPSGLIFSELDKSIKRTAIEVFKDFINLIKKLDPKVTYKLGKEKFIADPDSHNVSGVQHTRSEYVIDGEFIFCGKKHKVRISKSSYMEFSDAHIYMDDKQLFFTQSALFGRKASWAVKDKTVELLDKEYEKSVNEYNK